MLSYQNKRNYSVVLWPRVINQRRSSCNIWYKDINLCSCLLFRAHIFFMLTLGVKGTSALSVLVLWIIWSAFNSLGFVFVIGWRLSIRNCFNPGTQFKKQMKHEECKSMSQRDYHPNFDLHPKVKNFVALKLKQRQRCWNICFFLKKNCKAIVTNLPHHFIYYSKIHSTSLSKVFTLNELMPDKTRTVCMCHFDSALFIGEYHLNCYLTVCTTKWFYRWYQERTFDM